MNADARRRVALAIMKDFARRTGLSSEVPPRRYLWTDAFAVCNYVGLHRATGEPYLLELAEALVRQVHEVLGRHREDDRRTGWISGLPEDEGALHPTAGGLRIGKPLPERDPDEPWDQRAEWDRDGQYYHYLTKWLRALGCVADATADASYRIWAEELAIAMDRAFYADDSGHPRLHWKMSIDLSRPLVPSMGHHDPLDGVLALRALAGAGRGDGLGVGGPVLAASLDRLSALCRGRDWATDDPLGVGGLLVAAHDCRRLVSEGHDDLRALCESLISDAERSLRALGGLDFLRRPAEHRLAFRELGLAIGLAATAASGIARAVAPGVGHADTGPASEVVSGYLPLREAIERFWLRTESRSAETWTAHLDISEVMLATSLAPEGFLGHGFPGPGARRPETP